MDRNERVAALHDGRLSPEDRDELLNELFADEFESDVFAETAAVLRELEEAHAAKAPAGDAVIPGEPPPPDTDVHGAVIPLASRRPPEPVIETELEMSTAPVQGDGVIPLAPRRPTTSRRWLAYGALAAGIAGLALAAALLSNRGGDRRMDDPADAIAMLDRRELGPAAGWDNLWIVTRGLTKITDDDRLAVRLGATVVELELAAAATARDTSVEELSGTIAELLRRSAIDGSGPTVAMYDSINQLAKQGESDIEPLLAAGREGIRGLLPGEWLELGVWAETARTAALRHDADFFRTRDSRAALERIATLPDIDKPLATVRQLIPPDGRMDWPANDPRWTMLADSLADLLREAAG